MARAYGWRARIGIVLPANNNVLEPELYSVAPPGVAIHASRLLLGSTEMRPETLHTMEQQADRALAELAETGVDTAVYACLSTSLVKGRAWDEAFAQRVQGHQAMPLATVAAAVVSALGYLGAGRIAVASPYPPAIAAKVAAYFESWDLTVVEQAHLPTADVRSVGDLPASAAYQLGRAVARADCRPRALAILATDFATFPVLQALEDDLGCPVVSANQAALWWALRAAGVQAAVSGLGRLLDPRS
jgi:maleate isomerase